MIQHFFFVGLFMELPKSRCVFIETEIRLAVVAYMHLQCARFQHNLHMEMK